MRSFKLPANILVNGATRNLKPAWRFNLFSLLLSALILFGASSIAVTQQVTTRINGTIKDSAGATVPGAKITVTDSATKDQKTATSNEEGIFVVTDVRPGTYAVTVEATGFKKLQVSNVQVHVDSPVVLY
jgi:hypothetical protein